MEQERRTIQQPIEARTDDSGARLSGYAARFNAETVIAGLFRERIAPGAFAEAVSRDDVRALFNHDPNVILGRTKSGTLTLAQDDLGLRYDVQINPADPQAMGVWSAVQRGDVDGSSFAFTVDEDAWEYPKGGMPLRTIQKVHLFDVSPVVYPAYEQTSVSARAKAEADHAAAEVVMARARLLWAKARHGA